MQQWRHSYNFQPNCYSAHLQTSKKKLIFYSLQIKITLLCLFFFISFILISPCSPLVSLSSSHLKFLSSSHLSSSHLSETLKLTLTISPETHHLSIHGRPSPPSHLKLELKLSSLKLSPLCLPWPANPPSHLKLKLKLSNPRRPKPPISLNSGLSTPTEARPTSRPSR